MEQTNSHGCPRFPRQVPLPPRQSTTAGTINFTLPTSGHVVSGVHSRTYSRAVTHLWRVFFKSNAMEKSNPVDDTFRASWNRRWIYCYCPTIACESVIRWQNLINIVASHVVLKSRYVSFRWDSIIVKLICKRMIDSRIELIEFPPWVNIDFITFHCCTFNLDCYYTKRKEKRDNLLTHSVRICMQHKNHATTFNALIKAGAKKGAQKALMHIQGEKAEEVHA